MSHYFESGFCVRTPSWHRLETLLDEYPENWDAAREPAGLMWDPVSKPVYVEHVEMVPVTTPAHPAAAQHVAWAPPADAIVVNHPTPTDPFARYMIRCEDRQAIVRNDTGAVLGIPTDGYAIVDNGEMGHIVEAVLGADPNVRFDTAGSVRDGRQVYCVAYLDEPIQINGDPSQTIPYLTVLNSHDGTGACKVALSMIRVVCANTFQMADAAADAHGFQVSLRHTGDVTERVAEATQMIAAAREGARIYFEQQQQLAQIRITDSLVTDFLDDFIPVPDGGT